MVISILFMVLFVTTTRINVGKVEDNTVLYLDFKGVLSENLSQTGVVGLFQEPSDSLYHLIKAIDHAAADPRVVGIVARVDGAKMGVAQVQELRNAIMRFRVQGINAKKFTIAYADTFGEATPGTISYYLASAFDEIWLQPIGMLAFSGLAVEVPFVKDAAAELGIQARIGRREEYKTFMDSLTENEMTPAHRESLEAMLSSLMNQLVRDIALGREITEAEVMEAVNKGPLYGNEILKAGMIDRLAYFDEIEVQANAKVKGTVNKMTVNRYLEAIDDVEHEKGQPKIAVIYGLGQIVRGAEDDNPFMQDRDMDARRIEKAIEQAVKDEDVSAIVFRVNSPGGSPVASEAILRALRKAQQAGKPVVVSMSDFAASGGYWISSYADKIIAQPGTLTGSIGVFSGKIIVEALWKKLGIKWETVKVGDNATMWSINKDFTEYGWQRLQAYLDQIYSGFLQRVAEGRKLPLEHVEQVAKGRVWTGEDALKYSLVDKLGDTKDAIEMAKELAGLKEQSVFVQIYPGPKGFVESLRALISGDDEVLAAYSASSGFGKFIRSLISIMIFVDDFMGDYDGSAQVKLPYKKIQG